MCVVLHVCVDAVMGNDGVMADFHCFVYLIRSAPRVGGCVPKSKVLFKYAEAHVTHPLVYIRLFIHLPPLALPVRFKFVGITFLLEAIAQSAR